VVSAENIIVFGGFLVAGEIYYILGGFLFANKIYFIFGGFLFADEFNFRRSSIQSRQNFHAAEVNMGLVP
jgi:hypothetical protein